MLAPFLAAVLLGAAFPAAPGPRAAPQGLEQAVQEADALAAAEDWAGARRRLKDAMAGETARTAVLARLAELQGRLGNWAFREANPGLGPADLFSGEVLKFKPGRLQIRLRYDWESLDAASREQDFFPHKEEWYFAVPLEGDLKVRIEGVWTEELEPVSLVIGWDPELDTGLRVTPGFHRQRGRPSVKMPRMVERFGRPPERLTREIDDLAEPEGEWSYTVELRRGKITLRQGNKRAGKWETRHPELLDGLLGVTTRGLRSIEIDGSLQARGWRSYLDKTVLRMQQHFRTEEYDPAADYPAWMLAMKQAADAAAPGRPPEGASEYARKHWGELSGPLEEIFSLEDWVEKTGPEDGVREYARALAAAREGAWQECLAAARAARSAGLEFGPVLVLEARAEFFCGRQVEALGLLAGALRDWPEDAGHEMARLTGRQWGPREMLKACDQAIAAGAVSERTLRLRSRLAAAVRGPRGAESAKYEGVSLRILSDGDPEAVRELGEDAAAFIQQLLKQMPGCPAPREPMLVLHFEEQESRERFCSRIGLPADTRGYLPGLRLTIWERPLGRRGSRSLQGLLFEQFLDTSLDARTAPAWFVAGHKEYFDSARPRDYELELFVSPRAAKRMSENEAGLFFPPAVLAKLPPAEWRKNETWAPAESWLLVHFLRLAGSPPYQGVLDRYLVALRQGLGAQAAYAEAFAGIDPAALEQDLQVHRSEMLAQFRREQDRR